MRVADYIFKSLADQGVKTVFMVSGGGAMFLNDALGSEKRLRFICNHHEQASAIAAEGAARVSGTLGVVSVTTGPGGTNALTGLIGAWLDSVPILFISGQVKFETTIASRPDLGLRQLGDQEINIVDIVRPITKYATMVTEPDKIRYELEKAIYLATTGRKGPVWLDIPLNVQSAQIDPHQLVGFAPPHRSESVILPIQLKELFDLLCAARSPVIIAGHGIRLAGKQATFLQVVEQLRCPVLGTLGGFDLLPSLHPCSIGRIGTIGTRAGNIALQNADVVLSLGSRNNIRQTGYNWQAFAKRAKALVCVDIDANEMQKTNVQATHRIETDLDAFFEAFTPLLATHTLPDWTAWLTWCQCRRHRYPTVLPTYHQCGEGTHPYVFTETLTRLLPEQAVVACTNATPSITLFQAGIVKEGQRMFANSGCAAMGFGLPAAIGAAATVDSNRMVVCLEGDGSLMMNVQELQTVSHQDLPIKLFLFNNGEYCSIRQTQDNFFEGRHTGCDHDSGVSFPDWRKVAEAFSWPYVRIDSHANLDARIQEVLAMHGRVFCDVILTPGYTFAPKISSRRQPDGTITSPSLEDMFPFLPSTEMENNIF
jgi:acetolactate synthase-1/2/3 large subunit